MGGKVYTEWKRIGPPDIVFVRCGKSERQSEEIVGNRIERSDVFPVRVESKINIGAGRQADVRVSVFTSASIPPRGGVEGAEAKTANVKPENIEDWQEMSAIVRHGMKTYDLSEAATKERIAGQIGYAIWAGGHDKGIKSEVENAAREQAQNAASGLETSARECDRQADRHEEMWQFDTAKALRQVARRDRELNKQLKSKGDGR